MRTRRSASIAIHNQTSTTSKLPGTRGTGTAAAALLPQPTALIVMLLLTNAPAVAISNLLLLGLPVLFVSSDPLAATVRRGLFSVVLPITLIEASLYAVTMLLAFAPILQAHSGLLHGIKYCLCQLRGSLRRRLQRLRPPRLPATSRACRTRGPSACARPTARRSARGTCRQEAASRSRPRGRWRRGSSSSSSGGSGGSGSGAGSRRRRRRTG